MKHPLCKRLFGNWSEDEIRALQASLRVAFLLSVATTSKALRPELRKFTNVSVALGIQATKELKRRHPAKSTVWRRLRREMKQHQPA